MATDKMYDLAFQYKGIKLWQQFYDDELFVVKLTDGRVAAIEVKGGHLVTADDSKEKDMVGHVWAEASQGKCLFLMATLKDAQGRDIGRQVNELLGM